MGRYIIAARTKRHPHGWPRVDYANNLDGVRALVDAHLRTGRTITRIQDPNGREVTDL